jgi:hypothetical protein
MKDDAGVTLLPPVHRIEGFAFDPPPGGVDVRLGLIRLQYTDQRKTWHGLSIPTMDALYLLNLLEQWSKDEGLDHLRRPPKSTGE